MTKHFSISNSSNTSKFSLAAGFASTNSRRIVEGTHKGTACEAVAISAGRSNEATQPRDKNHAPAAARLDALETAKLFIKEEPSSGCILFSRVPSANQTSSLSSRLSLSVSLPSRSRSFTFHPFPSYSNPLLCLLPPSVAVFCLSFGLSSTTPANDFAAFIGSRSFFSCFLFPFRFFEGRKGRRG